MDALAQKERRRPGPTARPGKYHGLACPGGCVHKATVIGGFGYASMNMTKGGGLEIIPSINSKNNGLVQDANGFVALLSESITAILQKERAGLRKFLGGLITFAAAYKIDGANKAFIFDFKLIGKWKDGRKEGEKIRLVASAAEDADALALEIYRKAASARGAGKIYLSLKNKGNFI
jgi:hypothetical protein